MKPRLLDLMCGAGGAARGYQMAGFHVTGVDIIDQPNYAGDEFVRADALDVLGGDWPRDFDAIHASPPCQHYANVTRWRGDQATHPNLIGPTRELLEASGVPWVIENVRTPELGATLMLCGSQFGLPVRRHRYFVASFEFPTLLEPCQHRSSDLAFMHKGERAYADAMGCDWMTAVEARQAIPPAFTEFVGGLMLAELARV